LGRKYQCLDGGTVPNADEAPGMIAKMRVDWPTMLQRNPTLLVVMAAGNSGKACVACMAAGNPNASCSACQASENGYACSALGTSAEEQVLCVAASDRSGNIYTEST